MSASRIVVLVLIVATIGAVTLAPDVAVHHPGVWLVVTGLATATVIAFIVAIVRYHRTIRDAWSHR